MSDNMENGAEIRKAVEERAQAEAVEAKDKVPSSKRIKAAFFTNERGDGELYAELHTGRFIQNKTSGVWLAYEGHHWNIDTMGTALNGVEKVANLYLSEAKALEEKAEKAISQGYIEKSKKYLRRSSNLRRRTDRLNSIHGAKACLQWAHCVEAGLGIREEELDDKPLLLACDNGVVELKTARFRPGRPGDYLTKATPHEYLGIDHPAPIWEAFLNNTFDGDKELIAYIQRLFGYAITGETTEHIFPVLHGVGRNGKGVLIETLRYVLGPLAQPIQSEMLLEQRNARSASGPSPDIMHLKGLRIAFASETDDGRKFSTSRAKLLSGGDTLIGRNPHDKRETTFTPTHLLCLLTNHLPHAAGDDFSFWQRVHLIPFKMKFIDTPKAKDERQRDKNLPLKLKAEASGILAWLVRGCLEWQRDGLAPPKAVLAATEQYRFSEDTLAEFIEAYCDPPEETAPDVRVKYSEIYEAFNSWFLKNCGDKPPQKKKFSGLMERRFKKEKRGGSVFFYGIALKPERSRAD